MTVNEPTGDMALKIGPVTLKSRLIVGTGKYRDLDEAHDCLRISGADMVTVAIRRVPPKKEASARCGT